MPSILILPEDLLDEEQFSHLPPIEKSYYVEAALEKILELNQENGVTIRQVLDSTYFERNTVSKYLEKLVARRIGYKVVQGNTIVYHKNGRLIHHIIKKDVDLSGRSYSFKALFDGKELLLFIQENKKNPLGVIEEGGGILVPMKEIKEFSDCIKDVEIQIPFIKNKLVEMIE